MIVADEIHLIIQDILAELARAEHLHPVWPGQGRRGDHIAAAAIVAEEGGEVLKAANNYAMHGRGSIGHLRAEAVQTGAMAVRFLLNLESVERQRINESARQELHDEHNIEPETGDIVNWNWLNMEPIRYSQQKERLDIDDYTEGSGVE
jgi:hypothetical protein